MTHIFFVTVWIWNLNVTGLYSVFWIYFGNRSYGIKMWLKSEILTFWYFDKFVLDTFREHFGNLCVCGLFRLCSRWSTWEWISTIQQCTGTNSMRHWMRVWFWATRYWPVRISYGPMSRIKAAHWRTPPFCWRWWPMIGANRDSLCWTATTQIGRWGNINGTTIPKQVTRIWAVITTECLMSPKVSLEFVWTERMMWCLTDWRYLIFANIVIWEVIYAVNIMMDITWSLPEEATHCRMHRIYTDILATEHTVCLQVCKIVTCDMVWWHAWG